MPAIATDQDVAVAAPPADGLVGEASPSPAGPLDPTELTGLPTPPSIRLPRLIQSLRFNQRQIELVFRARRELGETFRMHGARDDATIITSHPDHVRSLFTASPEQAPSLTGESPLRPIVGPDSVLTAVGPRHMRQRKLLLPPFHGEAIEAYTQMISAATEREIDSWPIGKPFALAPRMQAITLDVIMAGIFGIEGKPERGTPEHGVRQMIRRLVAASTRPEAQLTELLHIGRDEAMGAMKLGLAMLDRQVYAVIEGRRRAADLDERHDILSLLLQARTEEGEALSDKNCATSCSSSSSPATRRRPTRWPGPGSAWSAPRTPTRHCWARSAPATKPRSGSRRRSSRRCARGR